MAMCAMHSCCHSHIQKKNNRIIKKRWCTAHKLKHKHGSVLSHLTDINLETISKWQLCIFIIVLFVDSINSIYIYTREKCHNSLFFMYKSIYYCAQSKFSVSLDHVTVHVSFSKGFIEVAQHKRNEYYMQCKVCFDPLDLCRWPWTVKCGVMLFQRVWLDLREPYFHCHAEKVVKQINRVTCCDTRILQE